MGPYLRKKTSALTEFIQNRDYPKNVLIFQGARQVGKTTLLKQILPVTKSLYFNLEREPSVAEAIDKTKSFAEFTEYLELTHRWRPKGNLLVIDEAQQSRSLGHYVRFMKEEWISATVILTGSVINELYADQKIRRPVGRESFLTLWPLTFKEFLQAMDESALVKHMGGYHFGDDWSAGKHERMMDFYQQYLKVGGLPEVITYYKKRRDYQKLRSDIFKSYEDDFIRYFDLEDVNLFRRCLETVANHVGSPSKDSQAVRLDAPGYKKIAGIMSRLEKWNLVIKTEQIGIHPEKNKFHPKRYLYDVGILSMLRLKGMDEITLSDQTNNLLRTPLGGLVENAVCLSLTEIFPNNVFGLKFSSQAEIDFGIKQGGRLYPLECKLATRFKINYLKGLKQYLGLFPQAHGFFVYGGPPLKAPIDRIHILPYYFTDEVLRLMSEL